jgi:large subunit ribosomal protein L15
MPLRINDLRPPAGAKRSRKRVGRGDGSGRGTYSGRGQKGQKSRAGGGTRPGFEGGQFGLIRKSPRKRGFKAPFRVEFTAINLSDLNDRFPSGAEVNAETLVAARLLKRMDEPFKVLAEGELGHPLTIVAPRVSGAAKQKIEAAGGSIDARGPRPAKAQTEEAATEEAATEEADVEKSTAQDAQAEDAPSSDDEPSDDQSSDDQA